MRHVLQQIAGALVVLIIGLPSALAGDTYWDVADGDWGNGANWTAGEPTASDQAIIDNDGVVRVVYSEACLNLYMGYGTGTETLAIYNAGNLDVYQMLVGQTGAATVTHQAGLVDVGFRMWLGDFAGGQCTYNMSGSAQLMVDDSILVGTYSGSSGELNIRSGADVSCDRLFAAFYAGADGTVLVDGTGSSLSVANGLYVGGNTTDPGGAGTITIDHDGLLDAGSLLHIWNAGRVDVIDGTLNAATVNMLGGATLNTYSTSSLDFGTVTLNGAGTTWTHNTSLYVSNVSQVNSLSVDSGAQVTSTYGYIGNSTGSSGTVDIQGYDSNWDIANTLYVGRYGTGTLNVATSLDTSASHAGPSVDCNYAYIGRYATGVGTVNVGGASSYDEDAELRVANTCYVGYEGTGTLNVNNAGIVRVDGTLQIRSGGTVNCDSVGLLYINELEMQPGGTLGTWDGRLTFNTLTGFGNVINWPNMSVSVGNGTATTYTIGTGQSTTVQSMSVIEGSAVNTVGGGDLILTGGLNVHPGCSMTVDGAGSTFQGSPSWFHTYGDTTVSNGGVVSCTSASLDVVQGTLTIANANSLVSTVGHADVASAGHAMVNTGGALTWGAAHTLSIEGLFAAAAAELTGGHILVQNGGTLNTTSQTDMDVIDVTVDGAASLWSHAANLDVDNYYLNDATNVIVSDGGRLECSSARVGYSSGYAGTVTVTGTDSVWDVTGTLTVGQYGTGTLDVPVEADVNCNALRIGYGSTGSPGNGTVTVGSSGMTHAHVNVAGDIDIGYNGTGLLDIRDYNGAVAGGTVTIHPGGTLKQDGSLRANELELLSGGTYQDHYGHLILNTLTGFGNAINVDSIVEFGHGGGHGSHTVGPGQTFACNMLVVGDDSSADFTVQNGATVSTAFGRLSIGDMYTGSGVMTVRDSGSYVHIAEQLYVGNFGNGELTIADHATVDIDQDMHVARHAGSNGMLGLSGAGTELNGGGSLYIGGSDSAAGGTGVVEVSGKIDVVDTVKVWPGGTLNLQGSGQVWADQLIATPGATLASEYGGTLNVNTLSGLGNHTALGGGLRVGVAKGGGTGSLTIGAGQSLTLGWFLGLGAGGSGDLVISGGGTVDSGYGWLGSSAWSGTPVATALVTGAGSSWTMTESMGVGSSGTADGTLAIANGGTVSCDRGYVGDMNGAGEVTISGSTSSWTMTGSLLIGSDTYSGTGVVNLNSGSLNIGDTLTIGATGTMNLHGGTLTADTIDCTHGGNFDANDGMLKVNDFMGHLDLGGVTFAPGQSVGTTTVSNGLEMHTGSYLLIELDGQTSGDFVDVTGAAKISTKVVVDLLGGFFPLHGNQWTIMRASGGITPVTVIEPLGYDIKYSSDSTRMYLIRTAPNLLGDANNDGVVSADDFAAVQAHFGNVGTTDGSLLGDANDDGVVSADDFAAIQAHFGDVAPYSTEVDPIPEPATIALLSLAGVALTRRRPWQTLRR